MTARHLGQRLLGKYQRTATHPHPHLAHVIVRRTLVGRAKLPLKRPHRETAGFGEFVVGDGFGEMLADVADGPAERRIGGRARALRRERPRDAGIAHHIALGVVQRDFRGHAPTRGVVEAAHQFHPGQDAFAAEHALIIDAVLVGQGFAAEVVVVVADHFLAGLQTEIEEKRHAYPLVSPRHVLHPQR